MKLGDLFGAGGRFRVHATQSPMHVEPTHGTFVEPIDEFRSYTRLGSDGIGYIVTVESSPDEAAMLAAGLQSVSDKEWSDFVGRAADR